MTEEPRRDLAAFREHVRRRRAELGFEDPDDEELSSDAHEHAFDEECDGSGVVSCSCGEEDECSGCERCVSDDGDDDLGSSDDSFDDD